MDSTERVELTLANGQLGCLQIRGGVQDIAETGILRVNGLEKLH